MRVGIVTTWNEKCGLAAYSENIVKHLPEVEWKIIGREEWGSCFSNVPAASRDCDLVHIMHQGGLMAQMTPGVVQACGKTVITRQCVGDEAVFNAATVKTCHVKSPGYRWVPHGIPVVDVSGPAVMYPTTLGCAGVPFDGKGHFEVVQIAERCGWDVNIVIPESHHTSNDVVTRIRKYCDSYRNILYQLTTAWLPEEQVVRILAMNTANVFFYNRLANGTSGAVRLGLAARRPVIVNRHSQFSDIIETGYVHVADTIQHAAHILASTHLIDPSPLVDMWGYDKTAKMYLEIYKEILG